MITAIEIENFKGFGPRQRIELRPVTLLYGPNSAGKSSVLDAFHYARELIERRNVDAQRVVGGGDHVDLGGFHTFVHNRLPDAVLKLRFDLSFVPPGFDDGVLCSEDDPRILNWLAKRAREGWIEFHVASRGKPLVTHYELAVGGKLLLASDASEDGLQSTLTMDWDHPIFDVGVHDDPELPPLVAEHLAPYLEAVDAEIPRSVLRLLAAATDESGSVVEIPLPHPEQAWTISGDALPRTDAYEILQIKHAMTSASDIDIGRILWSVIFKFVEEPLSLLKHSLSRSGYLGPIRRKPGRTFACEQLTADPGRMASGLWAWDWLSQASVEERDEVNLFLHSNDSRSLKSGYTVQLRRFKELDLTSRLMADVMADRVFDDVDLRAEIEALPTRTQVVLRDELSGMGLMLHPEDVGEGIAQLVPVVVATLCQQLDLVLIEQPELHVHQAIHLNP